MKVNSLSALAFAPAQETGVPATSEEKSIQDAFSHYLREFDDSGKARMEADIAEKSEKFDAIGWMLRVRHLSRYDKARQDLMAERNLDSGDLAAMSEGERIQFESRVYSRLRDELVLRMKDRHPCHCDEEEIRLYRAAPFLIS